jgi:aspartate racemase
MIGIVGGMGPFAGLDLMGKLLRHTLAHRDQEFLSTVILSWPERIPDRTEFLLGLSKRNPAHEIARQLRKLADLGAIVAGIPCNAAHARVILDVVQHELRVSSTSIRLINMIGEVFDFINKQPFPINSVGLIATEGTYRARIYESLLKPAGFTVVLPPEDVQANVIQPAITDPVYGIKAIGAMARKARADLMSVIYRLKADGAEAVILGCTELPLAIPETSFEDLIVIDPATVLARALIREADPGRLRPLRSEHGLIAAERS